MTAHSESAGGRFVSIMARCGAGLAVVAALVLMLAGFGSRWGWWHFRTGFILLAWGAYGGLAASALSLIGVIGAVWTRAWRIGGVALLGLLIGIAVAAVPWQWQHAAGRVPAIHDITTDLEHPPGFVDVLPLRANAPNPASYGGAAVAAQQRAAYPDLTPLIIELPPAQVYALALAVARDMGWGIVAAVPAEGRIEATDTTFWFGFTDDIVVRITPVEGGSRIDVRSVSRVGRSDVGTNARRIHTYLKNVVAAG
jgi:uncharacterized protein (DUF1499 family)